MVLDFWNEFEAIAQERTIVRDTVKQPGKGQTWGNKYATVDAVLKEWTRRHADDPDTGPEPLPLDLDALLAALPTGEMF